MEMQSLAMSNDKHVILDGVCNGTIQLNYINNQRNTTNNKMYEKSLNLCVLSNKLRLYTQIHIVYL